MKTIRSLYLIINYKTLIVTALSLISTWICMRYNFQANFPLTLVGIAIVFPVVFSIDSAYKRRERALAILADFKGHLKALYMGATDWVEIDDAEYHKQYKTDIINVYSAVRAFFVSKEDDEEGEKRIAQAIAQLSTTVQRLREFDLPSVEISKLNQFKIGLYIACFTWITMDTRDNIINCY